MPTIADYTVVRDSSFTIRTGGDIDYSTTFNLASGASLSSRAVLMYTLDPSSDARNLRLRIRLNGGKVQELSFTGGAIRTMHEVLNSNTLQASSNSLEFQILSGTGSFSIGNIVVLWQRNV